MSPEGVPGQRIRRVPFELSLASRGPLRGDIREGRISSAIVVCHGFKGFKDWGFFPYLADCLAAGTGAMVISFNFSGSGIGPDLESFTEHSRHVYPRQRLSPYTLDGLPASRPAAAPPAAESGG